MIMSGFECLYSNLVILLLAAAAVAAAAAVEAVETAVAEAVVAVAKGPLKRELTF